MRISDTILLGFESIRARKLRTMLNLVGIVLSSVLVICTLAATNGIGIALEKFVSQSDEALRFEVFPDYNRSIKPPADVLEINKEIPERRRNRIKERLISDWQEKNLPKRYQIPKTALEELKKTKQVVDVLPNMRMQCEIQIGDSNNGAMIEGASFFDREIKKRMVAGDFLNKTDRDGILIHEYLAFKMGFETERQLQQLVGKTVQIRFRQLRNAFSLLGDDFFQLSFSEQAKILSVMEQLLTGASLSSIDVASLELAKKYATERRKKMAGKQTKGQTSSDATADSITSLTKRSFKIVGVFRNRDQEDPRIVLNRYFGGRANLIVHYSQLHGRSPSFAKGVNNASVFVKDISSLQPAIDSAKDQNLRTVSAADFIQRIHQGMERAKYTIGGVVLLIMIVSAIGIANTMIIALVERKEEIGIMKAVGASNANVMLVILFECFLTGILAGVISLLLSITVAMVGNGYLLDYFETRSNIKLDGQVFVINTSIATIAFSLSVVVTTVAGIWPAWRAARLDPVVAMASG